MKKYRKSKSAIIIHMPHDKISIQHADGRMRKYYLRRISIASISRLFSIMDNCQSKKYPIYFWK